MTTYAVTREIHAEPQIVWVLLTSYRAGNPAVLDIEASSFEMFADGLKQAAERR